MKVMNSTTITISKRTRRELLKVAAELQSERGKKIDYEDVIRYLLMKTRRNPELLKVATAPTGVTSEDLHRTLKDGRHEEEFERSYS